MTTQASAPPTAAPLPKRFYAAVITQEGEGGHRVLLDGRVVRTPARRVLGFPNAVLAAAAAAEWAGQGEAIDPSSMPLTRLANIALDAVTEDPAPVRAEIVKYAGSDLLCYLAAEPAGLVAKQAAAWDPVIAWARTRHDLLFVQTTGVVFASQPALTLQKVAAIVTDFAGLRLAALQSVTTLTGSALLALALADGFLEAKAAWAAAHVDEDWNIALWGEDAEAAARRAFRFTEMRAAALALASGSVSVAHPPSPCLPPSRTMLVLG
jgi:chaperone required for assembly of F1-ATPase